MRVTRGLAPVAPCRWSTAQLITLTEPLVRCVPLTKGKGRWHTRDRCSHVRARGGVRLQGDEEAALSASLWPTLMLEVESEDDRVTVIAPNTEFAKARNALTLNTAISISMWMNQFVPKGRLSSRVRMLSSLKPTYSITARTFKTSSATPNTTS